MRFIKTLFLFFVYSIAHADFIPAPEPCPSCTFQVLTHQKWNYILSKISKFSIKADVYDIDGFDNSAAIIAKIHAQQAKAICYISAGTWENWRPDAKAFPKSIRGKSNGWRGEKWLDIRQTATLFPIMEARIKMCKNKGFDAVEFDNVDGYLNKTGFPLTSRDQIYYNTTLANIAHTEGLSVGLKNDLEQINELVPYFDFVINEQCFQYNECERLLPFIQANKPVLNVEYNLATSDFCSKSIEMGFNSIKKKLDLQETVIFCNKQMRADKTTN